MLHKRNDQGPAALPHRPESGRIGDIEAEGDLIAFRDELIIPPPANHPGDIFLNKHDRGGVMRNQLPGLFQNPVEDFFIIEGAV